MTENKDNDPPDGESHLQSKSKRILYADVRGCMDDAFGVSVPNCTLRIYAHYTPFTMPIPTCPFLPIIIGLSTLTRRFGFVVVCHVSRSLLLYLSKCLSPVFVRRLARPWSELRSVQNPGCKLMVQSEIFEIELFYGPYFLFIPGQTVNQSSCH